MGRINELKDFSRGQLDAALMKIGQDAGMGTAEGIEAWLRGDLAIKPKPLPFFKNEHGHYVFTITGLNLTGKQEVTRMKEGGFLLRDPACQILMSTNSDSYDANHRLEDGKEYHLVLILNREIEKNRTTTNIQKYARSFGYEVPLAGIMPRLRETVLDKQMEQMDIYYIAGLHKPIQDTNGDPYVLSAGRGDDSRWLSTGQGSPDSQFNCIGASAFLVPAS
jgi:hypothetical protein